MRPDFSKVGYRSGCEAGSVPQPAAKAWQTNEQIAVKPIYTASDLAGMEHLEYAAGLPPYLRGP